MKRTSWLELLSVSILFDSNELTPIKISIREMTSSLFFSFYHSLQTARMNPLSITPSQDHVKTPTTLDKLPEDVQLAIIKFIQSWKRSEGTEQEREKGKRWAGCRSLPYKISFSTIVFTENTISFSLTLSEPETALSEPWLWAVEICTLSTVPSCFPMSPSITWVYWVSTWH